MSRERRVLIRNPDEMIAALRKNLKNVVERAKGQRHSFHIGQKDPEFSAIFQFAKKGYQGPADPTLQKIIHYLHQSYQRPDQYGYGARFWRLEILRVIKKYMITLDKNVNLQVGNRNHSVGLMSMVGVDLKGLDKNYFSNGQQLYRSTSDRTKPQVQVELERSFLAGLDLALAQGYNGFIGAQLSAGVFAGNFKREMPEISRQAWNNAVKEFAAKHGFQFQEVWRQGIDKDGSPVRYRTLECPSFAVADTYAYQADPRGCPGTPVFSTWRNSADVARDLLTMNPAAQIAIGIAGANNSDGGNEQAAHQRTAPQEEQTRGATDYYQHKEAYRKNMTVNDVTGAFASRPVASSQPPAQGGYRGPIAAAPAPAPAFVPQGGPGRPVYWDDAEDYENSGAEFGGAGTGYHSFDAGLRSDSESSTGGGAAPSRRVSDVSVFVTKDKERGPLTALRVATLKDIEILISNYRERPVKGILEDRKIKFLKAIKQSLEKNDPPVNFYDIDRVSGSEGIAGLAKNINFCGKKFSEADIKDALHGENCAHVYKHFKRYCKEMAEAKAGPSNPSNSYF